MKKKILVLALALCLLVGLLSGCGQTTAQTSEPPAGESAAPTADAAETPTPETREFTDSTGRTVTVPYEVTKVAISGPLTQVYAIPLVGDLMVGVSNYIAEDISLYLPDYISELPELGQLYGGKGEMDLEALLAADPDVVIDVGDTKDGIAEDMDSLTEQTGIPFVHIDATVETAPEAYRMLGELTGKTEKAEELATWCEETYAMMTDMMAKVDADGARKSLLYCLGDKGLNVIAKGSYHAETINLMSDNLADLPEVVSSGNGNEVDLEQIMVWNPDVIIFAPDTIYDTVGSDTAWQQLDAISSGNYYKTPYGPYGWLSSPPSVQRYLGMLWLGALLYPDYCEYDLQSEVTDYYKLFYQCDLTQEMYDNLMVGAMPAE
ncbi:MAG: ABC transporter substrate-binding protein [Candidatus Scatomorpha sp.]|jgi:iron complex transport system substrate-binding protein